MNKLEKLIIGWALIMQSCGEGFQAKICEYDKPILQLIASQPECSNDKKYDPKEYEEQDLIKSERVIINVKVPIKFDFCGSKNYYKYEIDFGDKSTILSGLASQCQVEHLYVFDRNNQVLSIKLFPSGCGGYIEREIEIDKYLLVPVFDEKTGECTSGCSDCY